MPAAAHTRRNNQPRPENGPEVSAPSSANRAAPGSYAEGRNSVAPPPPSTYTVQPGDSLWEIATRICGDGSRWVRLWAHNRDVLPSRHVLPVGVTLKIPQDLLPADANANTADPAAPAATEARTYIVRSGDSLSRIAGRELGDASKWADIWKWNRDKVHNPNHLVRGMKLRLSEPNPQPKGPAAPAEDAPSQPAPGPESADNATPSPTEQPASDNNNAATTGDGDMAPNGPLAVGNTPLERQIAALWNAKGGLIKSEAARLGIENGVAAAVMSVESGGEGFRGGQMVIRFEKHIFRDLTGRNVWVRHSGRQADEYDAFKRAKAINSEAAHDSISMGAAQIMGFNAERIGYANASEMFEDFIRSESAQLKGMFEFIRTSRGLHRAAKNKDWATFAHLYNGPGYAANAYDTKMAAAYQAFNRVMARMPQNG